MKKGAILFTVILLFISINLVSSGCDLSTSLINQDPYPAVPGSVVELVFQIDGLDSTECGRVTFQALEGYPFLLDPSSEDFYEVSSGTYTKDYNSFFLAPFKFRVDENALDGEVPLEVIYTYGSKNIAISQDFDIKVQDLRSDFEVFVREYNSETKQVTFEILNIGKEDIEAVTVEIPLQENLKVYGTNKQNIGDLYSSEDTSTSFNLETTQNSFNITIYYSDITNKRRFITKEVDFVQENFILPEKNKSNVFIWIIVLFILLFLVFLYLRRKKHKKV